MNENLMPLWQNIRHFEFDKHLSEYGFEARLAYENKWTRLYARKAIEEYKKFIFLAAVSKDMISPSKVVDVVWHQHLVYTTSYSELEQLVGKKINHLPSSHNPSEVIVFQAATERTQKLYEEHFGKQPDDFWNNEYPDLQDFKTSSKFSKWLLDSDYVALAGIGIVLYFIGSYPLVKILSLIPNYIFMPIYLLFFLYVSFGLYFKANAFFKSFAVELFEKGIIKDLGFYELIYLSKKNLNFVVYTLTNKMVGEKKIEIMPDFKMKIRINEPKDDFEHSMVNRFLQKDEQFYPPVFYDLLKKPIFQQTELVGKRIKSTIEENKKYINFVTTIYAWCIAFILIGFVKFQTGIDVEVISINSLFGGYILVVGILVYNAVHIKTLLYRVHIPKLYHTLQQSGKITEVFNENDMNVYFRHEKIKWHPSFLPIYEYMVRNIDRNNIGKAGNHCGTSCGHITD